MAILWRGSRESMDGHKRAVRLEPSPSGNGPPGMPAPTNDSPVPGGCRAPVAGRDQGAVSTQGENPEPTG